MTMTEPELRELLKAAEQRREALQAELIDLAALSPNIRAAFGNPFFYSHPTEPDEGEANYTGYSSHGVGLPTLLEFVHVVREIARLKGELSALGS